MAIFANAWFWLAACGAPFVALPAAQARADTEQQQALRGIAMLDQRIAGIAHRLAVSAVPYCAERASLPGFTVHHLSQYSGSYRDAAIEVFGLDKGVRVLALVEGGPAETAGLARNDLILALDGQPIFSEHATHPASAGTSKVIEEIQTRITDSFHDRFAEIAVRRNGRDLTIRVHGEPGCKSAVYLEPSDELNARADGKNVVVTTAISMVVKDDDELAAVLAHELSHNLLEHKSRLDSSGWPRRCLRQAEVEADRLSVHLLDRAGYDPQGAVRFWRHFGPRKRTLFSGSEHPTWRRRVQILEDEIAKLRSTKPERADARPLGSRGENC